MIASAASPIMRILAHAHLYPDDAALVADGEIWTYREMMSAALSIAKTLPARKRGEPQRHVAIMADRHASSYIGILAAQFCGCTYVPINVAHPPTRSVRILLESDVSHVIAGDLASDRLASLLRLAPEKAKDLVTLTCGDRKADYDFAQSAAVEDAIGPTHGDLAKPFRGCSFTSLMTRCVRCRMARWAKSTCLAGR